MDTSKKLKIISTCTGIRGLERGIERAIGDKLEVAAYVEIEAFIVANLVAGMETGTIHPAPIWSDVKTFPFGRFRNKIHGIVGGYPCQPFSVAGNRNGEKDPRHLWPSLRKGIEECRPIFCFFENVRGHLSLGFEQVYNDLRFLGYKVEAGIFSAEEVGAPHKRERLFILAILGDTRCFSEGIESSGFNNRDFCEKKGNRSKERNRFTNAGKTELGDSQYAGSFISEVRRRCFESSTRSEKREECTSESTRASGRENLSNIQRSEELADSNSEGLQRRLCEGLRECSSKLFTRKISAWPSRPGQNQYDWEAQRTVESGVGITVDGYNFREDLLRAAGNGVVEQTAELAFRTLIEKFK